MSLLSEITIRPQKSKVYLRLIFVLYLVTVFFIAQSSLHLLLKLVLFLFILIQFGLDLAAQRPRTGVKEIQYRNKEWVLMMDDDLSLHYAKIHIILHNDLFQLIKYSASTKNKLLIIFNDQIPIEQLRLLHLHSTLA